MPFQRFLHLTSIVTSYEIGSIETENIDPHKSKATAARSCFCETCFGVERVRREWHRVITLFQFLWKRRGSFHTSHANLKCDLEFLEKNEGVAHFANQKASYESNRVGLGWRNIVLCVISCTACRNILWLRNEIKNQQKTIPRRRVRAQPKKQIEKSSWERIQFHIMFLVVYPAGDCLLKTKNKQVVSLIMFIEHGVQTFFHTRTTEVMIRSWNSDSSMHACMHSTNKKWALNKSSRLIRTCV